MLVMVTMGAMGGGLSDTVLRMAVTLVFLRILISPSGHKWQ
jgi:hypothetical protein